MEVTVLGSLQFSRAEDRTSRPIADFPPDVWGEYFISYASSSSDLEKSRARIDELKEEVREMFINLNGLGESLRLIDDVQRLGLETHFAKEVDESLKLINSTDHVHDDSNSLYVAALRFRLLRQQGYNVSSDVFRRFKDEEGKFKEDLSGDAKGLLCLYIASLFGTKEDEILDEALDFSRAKMEHLIKEPMDTMIANDIEVALKLPFCRNVRRMAIRNFIKRYKQDKENHPSLLELAKLDFNLVQSLHQSEIKALSIWWKELGLRETLSFARERVVECYFWSSGAHWEPQYSRGRVLLAKLIQFMTVTDDMFDAYGTLEELELLNDMIQRWEVHNMDGSTEKMRAYISFFNGFMNEIEEELRENGMLPHLHFMIESFKDYVGGYLVEARWANEGYTPTLKEYLRTSLFTGGNILFMCSTPIFNGLDLTRDVLEWARRGRDIIEVSADIGRLKNDIGSFKFEQQRRHVASSIQCYVKDHEVTEEQALAEINKMITDLWKEMNKMLLDPCQSKKYFNTMALDYTRVVELIYQHEDSFTSPAGEMRNNITLLFIDPI